MSYKTTKVIRYQPLLPQISKRHCLRGLIRGFSMQATYELTLSKLFRKLCLRGQSTLTFPSAIRFVPLVCKFLHSHRLQYGRHNFEPRAPFNFKHNHQQNQHEDSTMSAQQQQQEQQQETANKGQPMLPSLYFADREEQQSLCVASSSGEGAVELPGELLHRCLVRYADWGDLAKLACVQKEWSRIMMDAAEQAPAAKWELAQALMNGTRGLQQNHRLAFSLFHELANVELKDLEEEDQDIIRNSRVPVEQQLEDDGDNPQQLEEGKEVCFSPAMKAIAQCYLEGNGVTKNIKAGVAWLRSAYIMGGDVDAAHDLAMVFEYGKFGVENDIFEAAEWLKKAANAGHIEAMAELGLCYELGCGVEQSDTDALDWYMKAANLGHTTSKFSVAEAFEEARGVPQSDEEACMWYYKAAIEGDHDSKMALRRLEEIARIVVPGVRALLDG